MVDLACTTQEPDLMDLGLEGFNWDKWKGCPVSQTQVDNLPYCGWTAHPALEVKFCLSWSGPAAGHLHLGCPCCSSLASAIRNWFSLLCSTIHCRAEEGLVMSQHIWTNLTVHCWTAHQQALKQLQLHLKTIHGKPQFEATVLRKEGNTDLCTEKRKKQTT